MYHQVPLGESPLIHSARVVRGVERDRHDGIYPPKNIHLDFVVELSTQVAKSRETWFLGVGRSTGERNSVGNGEEGRGFRKPRATNDSEVQSIKPMS